CSGRAQADAGGDTGWGQARQHGGDPGRCRSRHSHLMARPVEAHCIVDEHGAMGRNSKPTYGTYLACQEGRLKAVPETRMLSVFDANTPCWAVRRAESKTLIMACRQRLCRTQTQFRIPAELQLQFFCIDGLMRQSDGLLSA